MPCACLTVTEADEARRTVRSNRAAAAFAVIGGQRKIKLVLFVFISLPSPPVQSYKDARERRDGKGKA